MGSSYPSNLAVDPNGNLWISGSTYDPSYPLLHPLQGTPSQGTDNAIGFLSEYDASATTLKFSTLYGGASTVIDGLAIAPSGIVNIAGTTSTGMYTTPNSLINTMTAAPSGYTYTYGFLTRINPAQASAALCLTTDQPMSPSFSTLVGTPLTLPVQIASCGELPLTIYSIQSSSSLFTAQDPAAACGSSIAPGGSCTVPVTFLPTQSGTVNATLTLLSNSSIPPQTLFVSAIGDPLPPTFSSSSLTFTTTPGVASPIQTITVTNVSDTPLTFTQDNYTQPFTVNNTCTPQLAPGLSCSILVGFLPSTAGTFNGSLSLAEDRLGQQTITLTGTAATPAVTLGPTTPAAATQTVTAGQPATYTLSTTSVGNFSGTTTFSCTGIPQYAACSEVAEIFARHCWMNVGKSHRRKFAGSEEFSVACRIHFDHPTPVS